MLKKQTVAFIPTVCNRSSAAQVQEESGFNLTEGIELLSRNVMCGNKILRLNRNKAVG